ncbi:hypothetical protein ANO14919_126760 [Xylariales sp. No.14919]|nr:hypothetical protein ANO14919_126760 [Xylariales sp. No.14919]
MAERKSSSLNQVRIIKRFSDLTLNCGGESFKAHKATVCLHSPVMAAALTGQFIEAQTNRIDIGFDLPSVKRLIDFMYTGDYQLSSYTASDVLSTSYAAEQDSATEELGREVVMVDNGSDSAVNTSDYERTSSVCEQLISHSRVNAVADYYDIPALETLSIEKARRILKSNWSAHDFCAFLRQSSGSTGDGEFFRMLATIAMEHLEEISENHLLDDTNAVRDLSPYMVSICCSMLLEVRRLLETTTQKAVESSTGLAECESLLSKWSSCRNPECSAEFNCRFETKGSPAYFLRCSKCRYRHE